jgi:hypothetical protein
MISGTATKELPTMMYAVTNPKTGKTYTYGPAKKAQAISLAEKLGTRMFEVSNTPARVEMCVCGRPADTHESYDCQRDWNLTGGW